MKVNKRRPDSPPVGKTVPQPPQTKHPANSKGWQTTGPRQSRAASIQARQALQVTAPPVGVGSPLFQALLDRDTHSSNLAGNKIQMLFDGVSSFAERNQMIEGAKESICFQTFVFNSDQTGWELAKRLVAKAKEGVAVRVIYDVVGSKAADPKMFDFMRQGGVEVKPYGERYKFWDINDRWHEKHLIIDGRESVQGGMNIGDEYAFGGSDKRVMVPGISEGKEAWRDADIKLAGPAVGEAMKAFVRNWEELGGKLSERDRTKLLPNLVPIEGGLPVRVVQSNPEVKALMGNNNKLYLRAIENAQKSITIENAYFIPPKELRKALIDASKRGVEVKIITNGRLSNNMPFLSDAARYFYDDLMKGEVKIYEKTGGTLHAKTATFDGEFSIVGSVNLNGRSRNTDAEVAVAVQDVATARELERRFDEGLKGSNLVTLDELNIEAYRTNLKQWTLSNLAWTF